MRRKLTIPEAADRLGISVAGVRVAIHEKRIAVVHVGDELRVPEREVRRYLARRAERLGAKSACMALVERGVRPAEVFELDWEMVEAYAAPETSLRDIAERYNVTRERVRQRIRRALRCGATSAS